MSLICFKWSNRLFVFAGLIALSGCIGFSQPTGKMIKTTSTVGHFSISHPEEWDFLQHPGGQTDSTVVAAIAHPEFPKLGVVIFVRRSVVAYNSIDEVSKWGNEVATQDEGYENISTAELTINGERSMLEKYTWFTPQTPIQGPQKMQCYGNYRLHGRTGFVITLCVNAEDFSAVDATFGQMMESFTYTD